MTWLYVRYGEDVEEFSRLLLAIEVGAGHVRPSVVILRLKNGRIAWFVNVWLIDPIYPGHSFHLLDDEPTGKGLEWCTDGLRFFEIPRDDEYLMLYWRTYESTREREGAEAVRAKAMEIAESEFGTSSGVPPYTAANRPAPKGPRARHNFR